MRTLFASDKAIAFCRVEREAYGEGRMRGRARGGRGVAAAQAARREGPKCGGCWEEHARLAL